MSRLQCRLGGSAFIFLTFTWSLFAASSGEVFKEAELAYQKGDFEVGTSKLEELISTHPGDFELASGALHRICLSDYAQLVSKDWPSGGFPQSLFRISGKDHSRAWEKTSAYLEEAFLESGRHEGAGGIYSFPPPRPLESLWRKRRDYPLTPLKDVSVSAANRILALYRSGYLENDSLPVIDASILLYFIRKEQKRFFEASALVDQLVEARNGQVDWLLARAKFHHEIRSPRSSALCRELFAKLDNPGVDQDFAKASIRAQSLRDSLSFSVPEDLIPGQAWINQLTSENEDPSWKTFRDGFVQGIEEQIDLWIQGTFSDDEQKVYLLRRDAMGSAVIWKVMDEHLKSLGKGSLQSLRNLQQKRYLADPRSLDAGFSTQARKLYLFRRYPWSDSAQGGLLDYARKELQAGHGHSAYSAFLDLIDHSSDPTVVRRARVGSWLANAQMGLGEEVRSAIKKNAGKTFPWMNEKLPAEQIGRILARTVGPLKKTTSSASLADLNLHFLRLPACRLWNASNYRYCSGIEFVTLQESKRGLIVSSRNLLARYGKGNPDTPEWVQISPLQAGRSVGRPGRFRPALSEDRIFTRWGYGADPEKLVAMDADSREIIWSLDVSGPKDAGRRIPLGNPVFSGGQVFVASAWGKHGASSLFTFRLSCIDGMTGEVNWYADQEVLSPMTSGRGNSFEGAYGDCLTIRKGKIYCSPGVGFVARFDARAGRLEWMHNYKARSLSQMETDTLGSAPLVEDELVFSLPRDSNSLSALDTRTGELAWKSFLPLPKHILGIRSKRILIQGLTGLWALDSATGKALWQVPYPENFLRQVYLQGSSIYLSTEDKLYRFEAETGIELETRDLPEGHSDLHHLAVMGSDAYLIGNRPSPVKRSEFILKGPGNELWQGPSPNAKAFHSETIDSNQSKLLLYRDEVLSCLEGDSGEVIWENFFFPSPQEVYFHEGKAIVVSPKGGSGIRLEAFDLKTGGSEWKLVLPRLRSGHGSIFGRSGKYLYGRDNTDGYVLVDLGLGRVILENRVSRRNGNVKAGFGGGRVHFMIIPAYRTNLEWLSWDIDRNTFEGEKEPLRGVDEDASRTFDRITGNWLEDAHYGPNHCYFVNRQDQGKREYVAYRANYGDRGVRVLARNPGKIKLLAPFLFLQGGQSEENRNTRTHTWEVRKADDVAYSHSLDLAHAWDGKPLLHANCVVEVRTPVRNQNPYLVQAHDLVTKKRVFRHSSEDAERMGVLPAGPNRVLVYEYRRNKRETEPYFKVIAYDLATGLAGAPIYLDYWNAGRHNPNDLRLHGNLLLIREHQTLRAWKISL